MRYCKYYMMELEEKEMTEEKKKKCAKCEHFSAVLNGDKGTELDALFGIKEEWESLFGHYSYDEEEGIWYRWIDDIEGLYTLDKISDEEFKEYQKEYEEVCDKIQKLLESEED